MKNHRTKGIAMDITIYRKIYARAKRRYFWQKTFPLYLGLSVCSVLLGFLVAWLFGQDHPVVAWILIVVAVFCWLCVVFNDIDYKHYPRFSCKNSAQNYFDQVKDRSEEVRREHGRLSADVQVDSSAMDLYRWQYAEFLFPWITEVCDEGYIYEAFRYYQDLTEEEVDYLNEQFLTFQEYLLYVIKPNARYRTSSPVIIQEPCPKTATVEVDKEARNKTMAVVYQDSGMQGLNALSMMPEPEKVSGPAEVDKEAMNKMMAIAYHEGGMHGLNTLSKMPKPMKPAGSPSNEERANRAVAASYLGRWFKHK